MLALLVIVQIGFVLGNLEQLCDSTSINTKCVCGYGANKNKVHYVVNCARTDLETLPDIKQLPPNFSDLDISHNKIKSLSFENSDFESATLKCLKAGYNEIAEVSTEFLRSLPNLAKLELQHNKITSLDVKVFKGTGNLHHLDLSFNNIKRLPDFASLHKLRFLDLSYNEDLGVEISQWTSVIQGFPKDLNSLALNYINLTDVHSGFFENSSLTSLSLADNFLKVIPRLPLNLVYLDLSGNYFTELNVRHLNYQEIKTLKLDRLHALVKIDNYAFYNIRSLETLSLEYCPQLTELNPLAFGVLLQNEVWNLKTLSLAGNSLRSLNQTYFKLFNKLEKIDLDGNPWDCDCHVMWFKLVEEKLTNQNFRCASPSRLRNKKILDITEKELPKCAVGAEWRAHKILVTLISVLVVILVALIMYLVYMGPYCKRYIPSNPVAQTSPYNSLVINGDS